MPRLAKSARLVEYIIAKECLSSLGQKYGPENPAHRSWLQERKNTAIIRAMLNESLATQVAKKSFEHEVYDVMGGDSRWEIEGPRSWPRRAA